MEHRQGLRFPGADPEDATVKFLGERNCQSFYLRYHVGNMYHIGAPIHKRCDDEAKSKHQLLEWT
jgi:hypothetical protein